MTLLNFNCPWCQSKLEQDLNRSIVLRCLPCQANNLGIVVEIINNKIWIDLSYQGYLLTINPENEGILYAEPDFIQIDNISSPTHAAQYLVKYIKLKAFQ